MYKDINSFDLLYDSVEKLVRVFDLVNQNCESRCVVGEIFVSLKDQTDVHCTGSYDLLVDAFDNEYSVIREVFYRQRRFREFFTFPKVYHEIDVISIKGQIARFREILVDILFG